MPFEGHFGDPLSNVLVSLNTFGVDEATHLEFRRLRLGLDYGFGLGNLGLKYG